MSKGKNQKIEASNNPFGILKLATSKNQLHWPVFSKWEQDMLLNSASRHGLTFDGQTKGDLTPEFGRGVVATIGSEAREAGKLYAYLTLRKFHFIEHVFQLKELNDLDVVVTTLDYLSPELFDLLQWVRPGQIPGLIYDNVFNLRIRCMVCALGAHGKVQDTGYAEYINDNLSPGAYDDKRSKTDYLRKIFSNELGLFTLQGHGDGIDSHLSRDTVLCARTEEKKGPTSELCGRCYKEDWCHRFSMPISDDELKKHILTPNMIKASIFLFDVCWGFIPPADIVKPQNSLGYAVTRNLNITSIISTWRPIFHSGTINLQLISDIRKGVSLGKAVSRHNASNEPQNTDHAFCVFGDPDTQLAVNPKHNIEVEKSKSPADFKETLVPIIVDDENTIPLLLIKHLISSPLLKRKDIVGIYKSNENLLTLINKSSASSKFENLVLILQNELLDFLSEVGPKIDVHWMYRSKVSYLTTKTHSCLCGSPPFERLTTFKLNLNSNKKISRIISLCQRCGIAEDLDPVIPVSIIVKPPGSFKICGVYNHRNAQAVLIIRLQLKTEKYVYHWPKEQNGQLVDTFTLPRLKLSGILQIGIIVIINLRFSIFSYLIPSEQLDSLVINNSH